MRAETAVFASHPPPALLRTAPVASKPASIRAFQASYQLASPLGKRKSGLRYNDDFAYLRDHSCHNDFWDPIKYIPLDRGGDWYLSFGGEIRERYERFHNPLWGGQPQSPNGYALQRYMLHADLHLGEDLRIYGELVSALENARVGGPRPQIDRDPLDLSQLFVDLVIRPLGPDYPITIRAGRQWLVYGSQRLISNRYGPNAPLPFDGVRAILYAKPWQVDAFVVKPTSNVRKNSVTLMQRAP
jgi:hypothetical protein